MSHVAFARSNCSDPELIARIADGDLGDLGVLFDRYEPDVKRYLGRLGTRASDVDDLVQQVFLDVPRAATNYDGRISARGWLLGLATMIVRRHRRTLARLGNVLVAWAHEPRHDTPSLSLTFELHEEAARAQRALAALSPKKRAVFVMVVLEDFSGEETAKVLGIPVATVWTRLHHARRELRAHLSKEQS